MSHGLERFRDWLLPEEVWYPMRVKISVAHEEDKQYALPSLPSPPPDDCHSQGEERN